MRRAAPLRNLPYCLTVDRKAPVYVARIFGMGAYAVLQYARAADGAGQNCAPTGEDVSAPHHAANLTLRHLSPPRGAAEVFAVKRGTPYNRSAPFSFNNAATTSAYGLSHHIRVLYVSGP